MMLTMAASLARVLVIVDLFAEKLCCRPQSIRCHSGMHEHMQIGLYDSTTVWLFLPLKIGSTVTMHPLHRDVFSENGLLKDSVQSSKLYAGSPCA